MLGAASTIPIPLAQLDFAGSATPSTIDSGDSPPVLPAIAAVGGILASREAATARRSSWPIY
jgi:hypothetical protein